MRVIRSGRDKEWLVTCPSCGSDLVYKGEDVTMVDRREVKADETMDERRYFVRADDEVPAVKCPECGRWAVVPGRAAQRRPFITEGDDWAW